MNTITRSVRFSVLIQSVRGQITQRNFANLLGLSHAQIQNWEKGIDPNKAEFGSLCRIADFAGISLDEIREYLGAKDDFEENKLLQKIKISELSRYSQQQTLRLELNDQQIWKLSLLLEQSIAVRNLRLDEIQEQYGLSVELLRRILENRYPPALELMDSSLRKLAAFCLKPDDSDGNIILDPAVSFEDDVEEFIELLAPDGTLPQSES